LGLQTRARGANRWVCSAPGGQTGGCAAVCWHCQVTVGVQRPRGGANWWVHSCLLALPIQQCSHASNWLAEPCHLGTAYGAGVHIVDCCIHYACERTAHGLETLKRQAIMHTSCSVLLCPVSHCVAVVGLSLRSPVHCVVHHVCCCVGQQLLELRNALRQNSNRRKHSQIHKAQHESSSRCGPGGHQALTSRA
jgi:hypothetical protein